VHQNGRHETSPPNVDESESQPHESDCDNARQFPPVHARGKRLLTKTPGLPLCFGKRTMQVAVVTASWRSFQRQKGVDASWMRVESLLPSRATVPVGCPVNWGLRVAEKGTLPTVRHSPLPRHSGWAHFRPQQIVTLSAAGAKSGENQPPS
jgi:hypothetical protein